MACKFFGGLNNVSRLATASHRIGWRWRETAVAYGSTGGGCALAFYSFFLLRICHAANRNGTAK